jgi:hypothetical protein
MRLNWDETLPKTLFKDLVRPRESLFRFGNIASVQTDNPVVELEKLFEHYVNHHFAQKDEYQETVMTHRLRRLFHEKNVLGFEKRGFVDGLYKFHMPFVHGGMERPNELRAIKPINLAQAEVTRIIDHGDLWCRRVGRLLNMKVRPENVLLPVKIDDTVSECFEAACEMRDQLQKLGIVVVDFTHESDIVRFTQDESRAVS